MDIPITKWVLNSLNSSFFRWYIDGIPIRVFRNYESEGIAYPNRQGMRVYSSLWNADNWATRGGLVKIDWSRAPFIAGLSRFRARACKWDGPVSITKCAACSRGNWWTSPIYSQLSSSKMGQLKWVRDNYMIYDYCKDTKRFGGQMPPECFKQQFWYEDLQWFCCTPYILFLIPPHLGKIKLAYIGFLCYSLFVLLFESPNLLLYSTNV